MLEELHFFFFVFGGWYPTGRAAATYRLDLIHLDPVESNSL